MGVEGFQACTLNIQRKSLIRSNGFASKPTVPNLTPFFSSLPQTYSASFHFQLYLSFVPSISYSSYLFLPFSFLFSFIYHLINSSKLGILFPLLSKLCFHFIFNLECFINLFLTLSLLIL